jgi:hypothetical protein
MCGGNGGTNLALLKIFKYRDDLSCIILLYYIYYIITVNNINFGTFAA